MNLHLLLPPGCFWLVLFWLLYWVGLTWIHFFLLVWFNLFFLRVAHVVHDLLVLCLMILLLLSNALCLDYAFVVLLLSMLSPRLYMLSHFLVALCIRSILCIGAQLVHNKSKILVILHKSPSLRFSHHLPVLTTTFLLTWAKEPMHSLFHSFSLLLPCFFSYPLYYFIVNTHDKNTVNMHPKGSEWKLAF